MADNTYTDPMMSLTEGPLDWAKDKLTGIKRPQIVDPSVDISSAKDVTPDQYKEGVNTIINAYNAADLRQQMRFIEILLTHEMEKVKAIMPKIKGYSHV
jgi:hypothetical protein